MVKEPLSGSHRQTFILLHGRGSNAAKFGPELLETSIPGFINLRSAFPYAKFIIPTASKRRAKIYKRTPIHQWFDNWSLDTPEKWEEFQNDGLRETSEYIHGLLRREIDLIGAENLVLGGLSQGCAATLVSLLLWEGPAFAAAFGMCGWLPYRKKMEGIASGKDKGSADEDEDEVDDIFQRASNDEDEEKRDNVFKQDSDSKSKGKEKAQAYGVQAIGDADNSSVTATSTKNQQILEAVDFLRNEIEFSRTASTAPQISSLKFQDIPLFLGHGTEDEKVPTSLGRAAVSCLENMDIDVHWEKYRGLDHWYSGDMLRDIVVFLKAHTDWNATEEV